MKSFLVSFTFTYSLLVGCAHVKPAAVACAVALTPDIQTAVNTALDTDQYAPALEALAAEYAMCVVVQAVQRVADEANVGAGLAARWDDMDRVSRARAWLAAHGNR